MGARARLQLREEVADVALDRLLGEEETHADLAVHEAVRDQLKDLDLPHRRLLLQLAGRALEGDALRAVDRPTAGCALLEPPRVVLLAVKDLFALSSVHARG